MAYQLLKGRKGLIFGALNDKSIAWKVAELAVAEGAEIAVQGNVVLQIPVERKNRYAAILSEGRRGIHQRYLFVIPAIIYR